MALTFQWHRVICFGSKHHPIKFKRKRGTFTLHNQVVAIETIVRILEVHGIRVDKKSGRKIGYIKWAGVKIEVAQFGKNGWCKR